MTHAKPTQGAEKSAPLIYAQGGKEDKDMTFAEATSAQARRIVRNTLKKIYMSGERWSDRVESLLLFLDCGVESEHVYSCFWKEV